MKLNIFQMSVITSVFLLAGCSKTDVDKDGVPIVDLHGRIEVIKVKALTPLGSAQRFENKEIRIINVQGKDMRLGQFVQSFCARIGLTAASNKTCIKASRMDYFDLESSSTMFGGNGKLKPLPAELEL